MRYGLPYKGSKNAIVERLFKQLPQATNFYDLFMGGGAITHFALLSHKYKNIFANEIEPLVVDLFKRAINGDFKNEKRWISREEFKMLKDTDGYIQTIWSFGNNGREYMYSKEIEHWKKALHYARVFGDNSLLKAFGINSDGSRADIIAHEAEYKDKYIKWYVSNVMLSKADYDALKSNLTERIERNSEELRQYLCEALEKSGLKQSDVNKRLNTQMAGHYFGRSQWEFPTEENYNKMREFLPLPLDYAEIYGLQELLESLQSLERLQRLQSLQSLESLQRLQSLESLERLQSLQRLEITCGSYEDVEILPDSVIYCDIPYENTDDYNTPFDHKKFYDWACKQKEKVFISSYEIKDERFICVWECKKSLLLSGSGNSTITERLYIPKTQEHKVYRQLKLFDL